MWLDPGTYMIARFMSFCKPGVTRTLDVTLGGRDFSSPILRSKDSLAEPMHQEEQVDEVQAIFPTKTPESS